MILLCSKQQKYLNVLCQSRRHEGRFAYFCGAMQQIQMHGPWAGASGIDVTAVRKWQHPSKIKDRSNQSKSAQDVTGLSNDHNNVCIG